MSIIQISDTVTAVALNLLLQYEMLVRPVSVLRVLGMVPSSELFEKSSDLEASVEYPLVNAQQTEGAGAAMRTQTTCTRQ